MSLRNLVRYGSCFYHRAFSTPKKSAFSILMYHRVTGDVNVELDIPFELFRRQMEWLKANGSVISYPDALEMLLSGKPPEKLHYVLTFDDAYEDFYTHVMPLLRELQLPATLFVPTEFIDHPDRNPLSRAVPGAERLTPMSWDQLREAAAEPLVTLGSHTHTHPELPSLTDTQIEEEMQRSAERFQQELGFVPEHFAYPRGRWDSRVIDTIQPYCTTATIVGGALASGKNARPYAIPRVPVRRSDGWKWFVQRAQGRLALEDQLIGWVKKAKRAKGA